MSRMRGMGPRGFLTEEEKQNAPKITKELIFRILKYLKPYWFQLLIVFAIITEPSLRYLSLITGKFRDFCGKFLGELQKRKVEQEKLFADMK